MLFRLSVWMALVTAGSLLVVGCRAPQSQKADARPEPSRRSSAAQKKTAPNRSVDAAKIEAHAHYATGVIYAYGEEPGLALNEFYEAALKDPENEALTEEVTRDFLQTEQPEKALALLKRATERPDASGELFARLGSVYFQLNKIDLATNASRTAIKRSPRLLAGYQNLFQIYSQNKQAKEAFGVLDEAAKISRTAPDFLVGLGELYARLGVQFPDQKQTANARALEVFQRAAKINFKDVDLRLRLADGLSSLGQYDQAASIYVELLKIFPDVPLVRERVRAKLADIYLRSNDRKHAADLLQVIIRDHPTDARAYYFLGSIAYDETNYVLAAECFSKTVLLNPDFEAAYSELASAQLALNKNADAQATLETGRKKFPRSFVLEYLSGMACSQQKDYTNTVKHFTTAEVIAQATATNRLNHIFYFQFGSACERLGDFTQAEKYFEQCLQLAPNFDEAQNYLGYMWAEHGQNLDRARELIEKALKAEPKNPAYLDSMAWVLFKLNQPQQALDFELKAIANSDEPDAEIYNHLGDIHAALGQTEKARDAWRKSIGLEPNEQVRKKLEPEAR
jgi:tetratricopeptide (TPR) repeat protein